MGRNELEVLSLSKTPLLFVVAEIAAGLMTLKRVTTRSTYLIV
jgi:hypothetical protein